MKDDKLQATGRIIAPEVLLENLSEQNQKLITYQAGGMKPAQASAFWNSQNPDDPVDSEHCSMIKHRYKEEYGLMRADVLKQVNFKELGGAVIMARERLVEMLSTYAGKGKQGTMTECLNTLQGLVKLYKDAGEELQSISPDTRSDSARQLLDKLTADNNVDQQ